jgi:hypothetical protein
MPPKSLCEFSNLNDEYIAQPVKHSYTAVVLIGSFRFDMSKAREIKGFRNFSETGKQVIWL